MLVVKIELHSANTGRVTEIGRMIIANVGGGRYRGDYEVRVARKKSNGTFDNREIVKSPLRKGSVKDYPRLSYNVWRLVLRSLKATFPEEK